MTARPAAPPPPDLSEQPRTAAGQSLLRQWSGHVNEPEVRIVVLAIEAEATAAVPTAADAWQAGYEACWNRLRDAGRLLPSDGATASVPLDVERLAEALFMGDPKWHGPWTDLLNEDMEIFRDRARDIAAEYARLSADEEGGTS